MKKFTWLIVLILPTVCSCQKQETARQYTEVISKVPELQSSSASEAMDPHAGMDLSMGNGDPHALMNMMGSSDPHAGYSKEQLQAMLQKEGAMPDAMMKDRPLAWTIPDGWEETPASGMRMATLINSSSPQAIDCSIVTLGAAAGGLAPNAVRWMQQIQIAPPGEAELERFIENQERIKIDDSLTAIVFDFTALQKDSVASTPSMIAAIIDTPSQRIFVKMTGNKKAIIENIKPFKTLVQSIKINP